jgi:hypothetical protein
MPPRFGDSRTIAAMRKLEASAGRMGGLPLVALCLDPASTRRWAETRPAPCYRCLAWAPDTVTGCHFTERGIGPAPIANDEPPPVGGLFDTQGGLIP